jgi:hypothetical protein
LEIAPFDRLLTSRFYGRVVRRAEEAPVASARAAEAYENLTIEYRDEDGVTIDEDGLHVHGNLFAFLDGDDLVVDLPAARSSDLAQRGVAKHYKIPADKGGGASRDWVRVHDLSFWSELTREAHEYVGEPAVGGDS